MLSYFLYFIFFEISISFTYFYNHQKFHIYQFRSKNRNININKKCSILKQQGVDNVFENHSKVKSIFEILSKEIISDDKQIYENNKNNEIWAEINLRNQFTEETQIIENSLDTQDIYIPEYSHDNNMNEDTLDDSMEVNFKDPFDEYEDETTSYEQDQLLGSLGSIEERKQMLALEAKSYEKPEIFDYFQKAVFSKNDELLIYFTQEILTTLKSERLSLDIIKDLYERKLIERLFRKLIKAKENQLILPLFEHLIQTKTVYLIQISSKLLDDLIYNQQFSLTLELMDLLLAHRISYPSIHFINYFKSLIKSNNEITLINILHYSHRMIQRGMAIAPKILFDNLLESLYQNLPYLFYFSEYMDTIYSSQPPRYFDKRLFSFRFSNDNITDATIKYGLYRDLKSKYSSYNEGISTEISTLCIKNQMWNEAYYILNEFVDYFIHSPTSLNHLKLSFIEIANKTIPNEFSFVYQHLSLPSISPTVGYIYSIMDKVYSKLSNEMNASGNLLTTYVDDDTLQDTMIQSISKPITLPKTSHSLELLLQFKTPRSDDIPVSYEKIFFGKFSQNPQEVKFRKPDSVSNNLKNPTVFLRDNLLFLFKHNYPQLITRLLSYKSIQVFLSKRIIQSLIFRSCLLTLDDDKLYKAFLFSTERGINIGSYLDESMMFLEYSKKYNNQLLQLLKSNSVSMNTEEEVKALDHKLSVFASKRSYKSIDWKITLFPLLELLIENYHFIFQHVKFNPVNKIYRCQTSPEYIKELMIIVESLVEFVNLEINQVIPYNDKITNYFLPQEFQNTSVFYSIQSQEQKMNYYDLFKFTSTNEDNQTSLPSYQMLISKANIAHIDPKQPIYFLYPHQFMIVNKILLEFGYYPISQKLLSSLVRVPQIINSELVENMYEFSIVNYLSIIPNNNIKQKLLNSYINDLKKANYNPLFIKRMQEICN